MLFRAVSVAEADRFVHLLSIMLLNYRKEFRNWEMVFALEGQGSQHRRRILPEYKCGRNYEQDVQDTIINATKILDFIECRTVRAPNGEADDAIAAFIHQRADHTRCAVISEDRDLWQLITPNTTVITRQQGEITEETCYAIKGVYPKSIPLYKALFGDKADNIPKGVPRMKTKTLLRLANSGTSPRQMYRTAMQEGWLSPKDHERLVKYQKRVNTNFNVVALNRNLQIEVKHNEADPYSLRRFVVENSSKKLSVEQAKRIAR